MPKLKTHQWSGVILSMKDMFGGVPGARYGWPKTIPTHWKGIQESIIDLCATVPVHFVIADGIVAMEGKGPLNGAARTLETIVLAGDPVAADATCARLTGFEPDRIAHICEGSRFLGNSSPNHWLRPKSRPLAATMTLHVPAWGQSQHSRLYDQVDWFRTDRPLRIWPVA